MVKPELLGRPDYPILNKVYNILIKHIDFLLEEQKILENEKVIDKISKVVKRYTRREFDKS